MPYAHSCVYNEHMKDKVNTYFAILLIAIAGAAAAWVIIRLAIERTTIIAPDSEASYAPLKESILKQ